MVNVLPLPDPVILTTLSALVPLWVTEVVLLLPVIFTVAICPALPPLCEIVVVFDAPTVVTLAVPESPVCVIEVLLAVPPDSVTVAVLLVPLMLPTNTL